MLVSLQRPASILEIGTFAGHGAVSMAERLPQGGRLVTVDNSAADPVALDIAQRAFAHSTVAGRISLEIADAGEYLKSTTESYDLIFVDADKPNYLNYLDVICDRQLMKPSGVMIFDNTLWGGRVLEPDLPESEDFESEPDPEAWVRLMQDDWARHVRAFNNEVLTRPGFEVVLAPIADGMTLIRVQRD